MRTDTRKSEYTQLKTVMEELSKAKKNHKSIKKILRKRNSLRKKVFVHLPV